MCRCYIRYTVARNLYTDAFHQNLLNVYLGQREFDYDGSDSDSDDDNSYQATTTSSSSSSSSSGNDCCNRSNEMQENKSNQKKAIKNKDFLSRSGLQIWSIGRSPIVLPSVTPAPLTTAEAEADSQTQILNYDFRSLDNSVDKKCFEIGFDLSEEVLSSGSIRKEIKNDIEIIEILKKNEVENLKNVAVEEAIEKSIELSRSKFDLLDYIETVVEMPE